MTVTILVVWCLLGTTHSIPHRNPAFRFHSSNNNNIEPKSLGALCNYFDGCHSENITCIGSRCICASGFQQVGDQCQPFECTSDEQCQPGDQNRLCDLRTGRCERCRAGLTLNQHHHRHRFRNQSIRCHQPIGSVCSKSRDCNPNRRRSNNSSSTDHVNLICRYDRCVCPPNSYPNEDWTVCVSEACTDDDRCDLFDDDPNRVCRNGECVCKANYFERSLTRVCLPRTNIIFYNYIILPLLLALLGLTFVLILIYVGKRVYNRIRWKNVERQRRRSVVSRRESDHGLTSRFSLWYYFGRRNSLTEGKVLDRSAVFRFEAPPPTYNEAVVVEDINAPSTSRVTSTINA